MRRLRRRLFWLLLVMVGLLVVVAAAAGLAYLLFRQSRESAPEWRDPISAIVSEEVAPDLALYPLAGASVLEAVDAAIDNGELQTALALLACYLDLPDRQRVGRLAAIGDKAVAAQETALASLAFQQIYDLAILSPRLNDPLRADALHQAAEGWAGQEQKGKALNAYQQMQSIAVHSAFLQSAQRRELLVVTRDAYLTLGQAEPAQEVRDQLRDLDDARQGAGSGQPFTTPDLPQGTESVSSPAVGALEEARRQAAFAVLASVAEGAEPPQETLQRLADALEAEDAAKMALYRQELESATQSARRIEVSWDVARWLLLKYCIAQKALGMSVVPAWESQLPGIQLALSKAYEDLYFDYEDLTTALPDASLTAPGRYEARRMVTLAGRLGQYPNYPAGQLADKLRSAVGEMLAAGHVNQLYVEALVEGGEVRFQLRLGSEYDRPAGEP